MKRVNIFYWVITGLFAAFMFMGAVQDAMNNPDAVKMISHDLGYPAYLVPFLGVAKILGCMAILVPGFPRLKEWAYAGLFFDLTGAAYSTFRTNPYPKIAFFIIFYAFLFASYFLYHKRMEMMAQNKQ